MMVIPQKNKVLLCEYVDYVCELCHKKFDINCLEIHRIRRGIDGGTYEHRNCKVVCSDCHKKFHPKGVFMG